MSPLRPIISKYKREPRKQMVSRSFRCPPDIDKLLDQHAAKKGWTKSFLIKDIIHSWFVYEKAKQRLNAPEKAE